MSELPTATNIDSEVVPLRSTLEQQSPRRYAGLSYEKALAVAEKHMAPMDVTMYLRPYLSEGHSFSWIAFRTGEEPGDVEAYIRKLEVQVAEVHLANVPRGYGHTAVLLTIVENKETA